MANAKPPSVEPEEKEKSADADEPKNAADGATADENAEENAPNRIVISVADESSSSSNSLELDKTVGAASDIEEVAAASEMPTVSASSCQPPAANDEAHCFEPISSSTANQVVPPDPVVNVAETLTA